MCIDPKGPGLDGSPDRSVGEGEQRIPRRIRERASGLLRRPSHILSGNAQRRRTHLSCEIVWSQDPSDTADLLNDRPRSFFEQEILVNGVFIERGTEYCGAPERYEYELLLTVENIDHTWITMRIPRPMGSASVFTRTS
jgi:hypothetical protein